MNHQVKKFFIICVILIMNFGCHNKSIYFSLYTVKSPVGDKCLTFLGEYGSDDVIRNQRIYLLGYNPNPSEIITKLPDSNYLALGFYGDMDGIDVDWESEKIGVFSSDKPLENKLNSFSTITFMGSIPDSSVNESHLHYNGYFFQEVHRNKYKSCQ